MKILRTIMLMIPVLMLCVSFAFGRVQKIRAVIVAFDPVYHGLKQPSFAKNLEVTIADIRKGKSHKAYIKLVFEGFGAEQVAKDVLDGVVPLTTRAVRDPSCDEPHPRWITDPNSFDGSGPFLLNEAHKTLSTESISHLECYRVQVGK